MAFRHPVFAKLGVKLDRANREFQRIEEYEAAHGAEIGAGEWGALSALSLGVHNIYNGIEDVMLSLANDVDGAVPTGETTHQDILDQMRGAVSAIRPNLLDEELYGELIELKGFRLRVRHRYGFDLDAGKVRANVDRVARALPAFIRAVQELEEALLSEDKSLNGPS